jgi:D-aspartate ligase
MALSLCLGGNMKVVLLGGDLNAYAVAVSFHEAYGVKSKVFCRYLCGITAGSSIVDVVVEPRLLEDDVGTVTLLRYARSVSEKPYLVACGDWYVSFLDRNRERLKDAFGFLIPSHELLSAVSEKKIFYALLEKEGLPYPKTVILSKESLALADLLSIGEYPAVLKPSNSVSYYAHPFDGMQKVYFPRTPKDALSVAERIFSSGYDGELLLQKKIGTDKDGAVAKTLTLLLDTEGRVCRGVLGEVLVEETAPGARGNYAAILTRPPDALTCRLVSFLERIGYTGIANVDIISDGSGSYILELNPRQGRSSDYLRAAGISIANFLVDAIDKRKIKTDLSSKVVFWHAVPLCFFKRRLSPENQKLVTSLKKHGRITYAFSYKADLSSFRRRLYVFVHALRRAAALRKGAGRDKRD